jgi:hypothetical protein
MGTKIAPEIMKKRNAGKTNAMDLPFLHDLIPSHKKFLRWFMVFPFTPKTTKFIHPLEQESPGPLYDDRPDVSFFLRSSVIHKTYDVRIIKTRTQRRVSAHTLTSTISGGT